MCLRLLADELVSRYPTVDESDSEYGDGLHRPKLQRNQPAFSSPDGTHGRALLLNFNKSGPAKNLSENPA